MKLIYISIDSSKSEGVRNKIVSKIKKLNLCNVDTKGFVVDPTISEPAFDSASNIQFIPIHQSKLPSFYYRRFIRKFIDHFIFNKYYRTCYKQLKSLLAKEKFDLIIFRYPLSNKFLLKFISNYRSNILFEHNTIEPDELKLALNKQQPAYSKLLYEAEIKYAPRVLGRALGIIGVTNEIVDYEMSRANNSALRTLTLTNSIEVCKFPLKGPIPYDGKSLNMLMLCDSDLSWHGVDLLLKSISQYKGTVKLKLKLIGNFTDQSHALVNQLNLSNTVTFTGRLTGEALTNEFNNSHLAIGSLALYRKGLREASTLKIREYLARGIPFVIGHEDPDLKELNPDLYLRINTNETNLIDINRLLEFSDKALQIKDYTQLIRDYAFTHVDTGIKMNLLKSFLQSL